MTGTGKSSETMVTRAKDATLKSIAKDLGITHTTVSNVYNNPAKVSEAFARRLSITREASITKDPIRPPVR